MIKSLPSIIKLPNYDVTVEFKEQEEVGSGFGNLSYHNFKVTISHIDEVFNKYLYSTFIVYTVASSYDINVSKHKAHVLGIYLYHVLQHNSMIKIFKSFEKKSKFSPFTIQVPSFELNVLCHNNDERPLGVITASTREIQIHEMCDPKLKNVILVHELIEWANTMYNLQMKHMEIQTVSEGLVYVINENKFTS